MKKILIIGANGFTGRQIVNDLSACKQYKLTGCSLHPDILPNNAEDYRFIETDIRNEADVRHLFKEVQPDVVINCSALSVPDYCETHHEEAYLTNVTAVGQLADLCEEYKSRFIHLSTDFVFDGKINEAAGLISGSKITPDRKRTCLPRSTTTDIPNGKEKRGWQKLAAVMPLSV